MKPTINIDDFAKLACIVCDFSIRCFPQFVILFAHHHHHQSSSTIRQRYHLVARQCGRCFSAATQSHRCPTNYSALWYSFDSFSLTLFCVFALWYWSGFWICVCIEIQTQLRELWLGHNRLAKLVSDSSFCVVDFFLSCLVLMGLLPFFFLGGLN